MLPRLLYHQAGGDGMALKTDGAERLTISILEAARLLGIGRNEACRAATRSQLPVIVVGRRVLVSRAGLLRMVEEAGAKPKG